MTKSERAPSGEDSLIARYFKPLATDPGAFNLGEIMAGRMQPMIDQLAEYDIAQRLAAM